MPPIQNLNARRAAWRKTGVVALRGLGLQEVGPGVFEGLVPPAAAAAAAAAAGEGAPLAGAGASSVPGAGSGVLAAAAATTAHGDDGCEDAEAVEAAVAEVAAAEAAAAAEEGCESEGGASAMEGVAEAWRAAGAQSWQGPAAGAAATPTAAAAGASSPHPPPPSTAIVRHCDCECLGGASLGLAFLHCVLSLGSSREEWGGLDGDSQDVI